MVNVGNGNVIVQSDDVDVHERGGLDLAFRRTYNSQSGHNAAGADGSVASNFGNGWTNTFDAHIAYYNGGSTLSVYDVDGARYDYTANAGFWTAPAGMQGTTVVPVDNCHYQWTKRNGTAYLFYAPDYGARGCGGNGFNGRIAEIFERNSNNYVAFNYSWDNGVADSAAHLAGLNVVHQDGQQLSLIFQDVNGVGPRELHTLTRPDGQQITYSYDSSGNLTQVNYPGNNVASQLWESYTYSASDLLASVSSPRYTYSYSQTGGNPTEGTTTNFAYDGSARLQYMQRDGVVNFSPADGTGSVLQPGISTGVQPYYQENFSGYSASPTCVTSLSGSTEYVTNAGGNATTSVTDTDGHSTSWTVDGCWRPNETQDYTGNLWLIRNQSWDNQNDLTSSTDDRGNETDFAYDANGNLTKKALPAVSNLQGTFRPTSVYSYDAHNNITAFCDPVESNTIGQNWTADPGITSDVLCPSQTGAQRFTWATSAVNTYGFLTDMYTAAYDGTGHGNHTHFIYDISREGGNDYGLPTTVTGDTFTQQDGSSITPTQSFSYDADGNLSCYSKLADQNGTHWWRLTYDNLNRQTAVADPDDQSVYSSVSCPNSAAAGMAGSHLVTTTSYYADGETASTQTPTEYAGGVSTTFTYDADGNETTETHHFNNVAGTTTKWYDGEDRLVEVELPHDATDYYSYNWLTRYFYDLSKGGPLTVIGDAGIYAHGNLYKTQKWMGPQGWADIKGNAFDALDRSTAAYSRASWQSGTSVWTSSYDQSPQTYGLLGQKTDPLSEVTSYTYDADGETTNTSYSGDGGVTPAETVAYDADGRPVSTTSSSMGTLSSSYDADGKVISVTEPSGGGLSSAATYTYNYYPNGLRSALSVSSTALTQNDLFRYNYRADGARTSLNITDGSLTASITWALSAGARIQSMSDSSGEPARTLTYDAYGRITQDQIPSANIAGQTYDDEGERTGYSYPGGNTSIGYNVRGELTSQTYSNAPPECSTPPAPATFANMKQQSAYGAMIGEYYDCNQMRWTSGATLFDAYTGANLGPANLGDDAVQVTYDRANRQTVSTDNWQWTHTSGDLTQTDRGTGTVTRAYDAENHLLSEDTTGQWDMYDMPLSDCIDSTQRNLGIQPEFDVASGTYVWGPNGHPVKIDGSTYHWDGDSPLFMTSATGTLERIDVEGLAVVAGGAVSFLDRDQTGSVVAEHSSGSAGTWYPATPYHNPCASENLSDQPGPDGIDDGVNVLQGVRSYDPSLKQWSTPDAYQGDLNDPSSQQPYMWNRNNPYAYSDPSGYCPDACVLEGGAAAAGALTVLAWGAAAVGATGIAAWATTQRDKIAHAVQRAAKSAGGAMAHAWKSVQNRLPRFGPPGSTVVRPDGKQIRTYGKNGGAVRDIDYGHDHGAGDPHAHDWQPGADGQPARGPGRSLTPQEQNDHGTAP